MRSDEVSEWSQSIFNLSTEEQVFWSEQKSEYEGTVSYLCTNAHLERKYLSIVQYLKSPKIRGFIAYIKNQPTYISHSITFLWYQILLWAVPDKVGYRVYAAAHAPLRGPNLVVEYYRPEGTGNPNRCGFICCTQNSNASRKDTQRTLALHMESRARIFSNAVRIIGATVGDRNVRFWEWDHDRHEIKTLTEAPEEMDVARDFRAIAVVLNNMVLEL
jgi:hypothetical protein